MLEDYLNDILLSMIDEADDLHCVATIGAFQGIDFVHLLDQTCPNCQFDPWPLFRSSFS